MGGKEQTKIMRGRVARLSQFETERALQGIMSRLRLLLATEITAPIELYQARCRALARCVQRLEAL